ncbi:MAG: 4-hydroxy-tetrahydrodipicolinate reductase [Chitinophagales bacterium]|nr:4-hydroxy-tetrahydrodipicolinate reductase [Chitinophagales bacterium]MBP9190204.1 4-hydroxy-tetrahydrodipicolinate reductase [Chitinophagales bacterium]
MKVALIGYGKMGKSIEEILNQQNDTVVLKIGSGNIDDLTKSNLQQADVAIEFTAPHLAVQHIQLCVEAGVPVVCGTTGWSADLNTITKYCNAHNSKLVHAPNFSIGVNLFFEINKIVAAMFSSHPDYKLSITEIHHTEKKDAPSGTAIQLANIIMQSNPVFKSWVNNSSEINSEIPITSIREQGVPGTHSIEYDSAVDSISLTHVAKSRYGFASGAVLAAKWLLQQPSGVYTMRDVLKLH